jgi:AraC family cel operon transcriptional repressor
MAPAAVQRLRIRNFLPAGEHCHFHRQDLRPKHDRHMHCHDFHELFWIESGSGWQLLKGERRALPQGLLVLVHADDEHGFGCDEGRSCMMANLAFPLGVWDLLHRRCFPNARDAFAQPYANREFVLRPAELRELQGFAEEITEGARGLAAIERFLLNLMHLLSRRRERPAWAVPEWLEGAVERLQDPRQFHEGTSALVALCGRSAEHVAREVRRCYGKTPTDLVNEARMSYAARRLNEGDTPIIDICYECGFSNLGHFYRLFRELYRVPPNRYRQRHRHIVQPEGDGEDGGGGEESGG